jgi:alanyl-tRNA synthetase
VSIWKDLFSSVGINAEDLDEPETKGMRGGRIFYYGVKKNWWSREGIPSNMPPGEPGGPDSEMFYEFSDVIHDPAKFGPVCHVNCDCGRYIEIGNNVFMEYLKKEDGSFAPLPSKNVDFGGGLERMTAASENQSDIFLTSAFRPVIEAIQDLTGTDYTKDESSQKIFRIIADHAKAATFLISDGVVPSNKLQGYVLRRLIRRAVRYARLPGMNVKGPFLGNISAVVINMYKDANPELYSKKDSIIGQFTQEEERFEKTLSAGLKEAGKAAELNGSIAFRLYESFGFPFELTEELARERGQKVQYGEFRKEFEKHQEKSRAGAEKKFGGHGLLADTGELKAGTEEELRKATRLHTATHLLQAALREVLGSDVSQAGSDITPERLRFDFTFSRKMTEEEIKKVEEAVNRVIQKDISVTKQTMTQEEATKTGALHFFRIKYPPMVDVYSIGDFSKEFCGGPHVLHTAEVGKFKILKEEAVSAGVRRIRATVE